MAAGPLTGLNCRAARLVARRTTPTTEGHPRGVTCGIAQVKYPSFYGSKCVTSLLSASQRVGSRGNSGIFTCMLAVVDRVAVI